MGDPSSAIREAERAVTTWQNCAGASLTTRYDVTVALVDAFRSLLAAAREAREEIVGLRANLAGAHGALKLQNVPEQIPPFKAALAPVAARIMYLGRERDEAREERDRLREGLTRDVGLLLRYRAKFACDGMNGRGWDARVHLWADDALTAMGEPSGMTMETAEKVMLLALAPAPGEGKP